MDLVSYITILGKSYLWSCRHKHIKQLISHFKRILDNKYETEKYIAFVNGNPMKNCLEVA